MRYQDFFLKKSTKRFPDTVSRFICLAGKYYGLYHPHLRRILDIHDDALLFTYKNGLIIHNKIELI